MPLYCHHELQPSETMAQIKCFLLEVALVLVLHHSNREVIKTYYMAGLDTFGVTLTNTHDIR